MKYSETIEDEIKMTFKERDNYTSDIRNNNNSFAEYLKENFDGQIEEILENDQKIVETEKKKSKFKKFFEKLSYIL